MEFFKDLNQAQKEAVTHGEGPLLIVAGAGTGKTTVITRRIAWLIAQGLAKPEEILALTFTDKAASEMEERVDKILPYGYVNLWVSTFHSFGERILKDYALEIGLPNDFQVLTSAQQWMLVRNNLERFALTYYRPLGNPTKFIHALLQHFSRAKDELVSSADYLTYVQDLQLGTVHNPSSSPSPGLRPPSPLGRGEGEGQRGGEAMDITRLQEVAEAYHVYQQLLLEKGALDFGDLINYTLQLLQKRVRVRDALRRRFKYILVDEFQDTNLAQYELIKLLAAPQNNLTVVADDDQSVYKFRGASVANVLQFIKDFESCQKVALTANYRSCQNILDLAYNFIEQNNPDRLEVKLAGTGYRLSKKLAAARQGAAEIAQLAYRTAEEEAEGVVKKILELKRRYTPSESPPPRGGEEVAWGDFAILLRANSSAPIFLQALRRHGIPFEYVANRGLYKEAIILQVLAYLKLLDNYHESEALYRVLSEEPFVLPHADLATLAQYAGKKTISLYAALHSPEAIAVIGAEGQAVISRLLELIAKHSALARLKSAAELYVTVVHDLGLEERVAHPALAREAQFLASFYKHLQRFEIDSNDHSLNAFLKHLTLELESGEQGELPEDFEEGPDTVKIITVHSAKGLEWRFVFLVHLIDRRFPSMERREPIELPAALIKETLPEGDAHLQEERRLFYVAMTRAKEGLFITRAQDYSGKTTRKPSRFLYELGIITPSPPPSPATLTLPSPLGRGDGGEGRGEGEGQPRYPIPETFSFSSVSAFRKCPLEYKFRYLLKLPGPGSAQLSFGNTIHKTLELFLKLWQQRQSLVQGELFSGQPGKITAPTRAELDELYDRHWIDDWYGSAAQKQEYRAVRGPQILTNFYEHFTQQLPSPKYLEAWFKIAMGPYKFVGKIDRIDAPSPPPHPSPPSPLPEGEGRVRAGGRRPGEGVTIIDYKTGESAHGKLQKVDKEQLVIYQIAAAEFLHENIAGAVYWDLWPNTFTEPFVAAPQEIEELKKNYTAQIEAIVRATTNDSFLQVHTDTPAHDCKYKHLA